MVNPFNAGDKVLAMRKGIEIAATVRASWNHEVQIRSEGGELLWRTMNTIRMAPAEASEPESGAFREEQQVTDESHLPQEQPPVQLEPVVAQPAALAPVSEATQEDLSADDEAASTEEEPEVAPEEPAAMPPRPRERRKGSHGEKSRSKRSRK